MGHFCQRGIEAEATHVVDDRDPGGNGFTSHVRFGGVDRNWHFMQPPSQPPDRRQYAGQLLFGGNRLRAWPRRLTAHVDPICSLAAELDSVRDGTLWFKIPAAVGK